MILFFIIAIASSEIFEIEQEKDLEVILNDLENLKDRPIDINTAGLEEFLKIPFLKTTDCLKLIAYREEFGPFKTVDDLFKIKGIDSLVIEQILPYITIKKKPIILKKAQSRLRLQRELNSDNEYYTRTIIDVNDYRIFFVSEKDPYENSLIDFYSAGIVIDEGKRRFAFGRYNLDLGLGVVLSSIGSFFQGTDFRMLTSERGIIPYTSTIEDGGFFGAAISDSLFLNYALFYSNQKLDGRIDTAGYARSFDESGNHTDSASIARKDRIKEELFGYHLNYRHNTVLFSNHTYWSSYEPPFVCDDSLIDFYGRNYWLSALGLKYYAGQFIIFSEIARSFNNRFGGVFGLSGILPYNFNIDLAGEYFVPGFYAPKGSEADDDYIGTVININNSTRIINAGTTLNIATTNNVDTTDYDFRLNFNKIVGFVDTRIQLRWLFKNETKELSGSRLSLRVKPRNFFYLDLRLEEKYDFKDTLKKGIFGGIESGIETKYFNIKGRYGLYDTDSYATRIYVYEPDLPGIVNNRVVYGSGKYGLIYMELKPLKNIILAVKYLGMDKDSLTHHIGFQIDAKF